MMSSRSAPTTKYDFALTRTKFLYLLMRYSVANSSPFLANFTISSSCSLARFAIYELCWSFNKSAPSVRCSPFTKTAHIIERGCDGVKRSNLDNVCNGNWGDLTIGNPRCKPFQVFFLIYQGLFSASSDFLCKTSCQAVWASSSRPREWRTLAL